MAVREAHWMNRDREKQQRISQELSQLKQMSKRLRTEALRSYLERAAAQRVERQRPAPPIKNASSSSVAA